MGPTDHDEPRQNPIVPGSKRNDVTLEGHNRIQAWMKALDYYERCRENMEHAFEDVQDTEKTLAAWILPPDVKPGEKICVWYRDSLIQCTMPEAVIEEDEIRGKPTVTFRNRGRETIIER